MLTTEQLERFLCRGKCIDRYKAGEWITGYFLFAESSYGKIHAISILGSDPVNRPIKTLEIEPSTLGQCTGLRDKNGTLIFEGDIVRIDGDNSGIWTIENVGGGFCAIQGEKSFAWYRYAKIDHSNHELVIIGNVHDGVSENADN